VVPCCSAMADHSNWEGLHSIHLMPDSAPSVTGCMQLAITYCQWYPQRKLAKVFLSLLHCFLP